MRSIRLVLMTVTMLLSFGLANSINASDSSPYKLAYMSYNDNQIWTINPDGSEARQITDDGAFKQGMIASPDGKYLAYYTQSFYDSAKYRWFQTLVILDMTTGQQQTITGQEAVYGYSWSADSQQVLFRVLTYHDDYLNNYELYVINRDGTKRTQLGTGIGLVPGFTWSPDAKHILESGRKLDGSYHIISMDADGTNRKELAYFDSCFICWPVQWTPDSQHIVFYKHPDLFLMDTNGQNQRQLTDFTQVYNVTDVAYARYGFPSFSFGADSQTLYYTMGYPLQIVKMNLGENGWVNRTVLYNNGMRIIADNQLSPDGKLLFFSAGNADGNGLSSLDLNTHEVHVLAKHVSQPVFIAAN
jgi:Tol biopolymer transport system component